MLRTRRIQENQQQPFTANSNLRQVAVYIIKEKRAVCIIGGESRGIRISSRTMEESRQRDWFCIKTLHYFAPH